MDTQTRATVALKLLQASIAADNQDEFDFLSSIIESEGLYCCYSRDDGVQPFNTHAEFLAEVEREYAHAFSDSGRASSPGLGIFASAGNVPLCKLSTEQRYATRMARVTH